MESLIYLKFRADVPPHIGMEEIVHIYNQLDGWVIIIPGERSLRLQKFEMFFPARHDDTGPQFQVSL